MTVLENIMVGRHLKTKSEILASGFRLGRGRLEEIQSRNHSLDILQRFGFEKFADMTVGMLSYGQQRIVELARALATEPKLLLLDEPLSGLNFEEIEMLVSIIRSIASSAIGVLIVEHNMEVIMSVADKLYVLNFGKKIAEGPPGEIAKDRLVIDAYLGHEFKHAAN
jgi:branched-chain amino acid transport system ATP-binding protein